MKVVRFPGIAALIALAACATATPAFAQSNNESFPQFQWNFSTPGARANAMGRAFIALADDASAAIANPAGLVRLAKRQVYFEFKSTALTTDRLADIDSLFTLIPTTFESRTNAPSFISFSQPMGEKLAFGFAMHQFLNFKEEFELEPRPIPTTNNVFRPLEGETNFTGTAYAASVAYSATENLQIGATLTFNRLKAAQRTTRFLTIFGDPANQFDLDTSSILINESNIDESQTGIGIIAGLLWSSSNDKLSLGVQFTKAPRFTVEENLEVNNSGTLGGALTQAADFPKDVHINVPNRMGFGLAYRITPRLLAALDIVRIGYSSLAQDFALVFPGPDVTAGQYSIDDKVETHFGGEYQVLTGDTPLFIRGGVYTSPDHSTRYSGANPREISIYNLLPRTNEVIGTFGAGVAVKGKFQLDLAIVSDKEVVFSFAARF